MCGHTNGTRSQISRRVIIPVWALRRGDRRNFIQSRWSDDPAMVAIGGRNNEIGTLVRDGGTFYLRRDVRGRYKLELHRTPVDLVE
jgi:hypothetical protein